jgi:hypothetical protein
MSLTAIEEQLNGLWNPLAFCETFGTLPMLVWPVGRMPMRLHIRFTGLKQRKEA